MDRSLSFNCLPSALTVLFAPCGMLQLTTGSIVRLRRDCVDLAPLRGVKLQLPFMRPDSFKINQGISEDKEQGMATVEAEDGDEV